jgi:hypothetical protein
MLRPVCLSCIVTVRSTPQEIGDVILDLSRWADFTGYGPLPGIKEAIYERKTPEIVGTVVAVTNTDRSKHAEVVLAWDLPDRIVLRLERFSRPLSFFATHFIEHFDFEVVHHEGAPPMTKITRRFELFPRSWLGYPLLWLVRPLMRKAIDRSNSSII